MKDRDSVINKQASTGSIGSEGGVGPAHQPNEMAFRLTERLSSIYQKSFFPDATI